MIYKNIGKWHKFASHNKLFLDNQKGGNRIRLNKNEITFLLLEIEYDSTADMYITKILYEGKVYYFQFWRPRLERLICLH